MTDVLLAEGQYETLRGRERRNFVARSVNDGSWRRIRAASESREWADRRDISPWRTGRPLEQRNSRKSGIPLMSRGRPIPSWKRNNTSSALRLAY